MYKLLAAVLSVCVDWVFAKVQLHSAQSLPQRHRTVEVSTQHKCQVLLQIVATSTVHEQADESSAGPVISLLGFRLFLCPLDVVPGVLLVCKVQYDCRLWSGREGALLRHGVVDRDSSSVVHGVILCPLGATAPSVCHSASDWWSFRAVHSRTSHGFHTRAE